MTTSPVVGGSAGSEAAGASVAAADLPPSWGSGLAWLRPEPAVDLVSTAGDSLPTAGGILPTAGGTVPAAGGIVPTAGAILPTAGAILPTAGGIVPTAGGGRSGRPADPAGLLVGDGAVVLAGGVATWLPEGRWVAAPEPGAGTDRPEAEADGRRSRRPAGGRAGRRFRWRPAGRSGPAARPGAGRVALARWGARAAGWPRRVLVVVLLAAAVLLGLRPDRPLPPVAPAAPSTTVVVAARDLPAGRVLAPADLRTVRVPTAVAPSHTAAGAAALVGRTVAGPMRRGEAVTDARVVGPGLTAGLAAGEAAAVAVRLADPETAALVRPGDRIDVLSSPAEPDGTRAPPVPDAVAVASGVRVLAVLGAGDPADGVVVVVAAGEQVARRLAGGAGRHRLTAAVRPP